jgi:hypothetical protein
VADIYTVEDTQWRIQCQIYSTGSRYTFTWDGYTGAETRRWIYSGRNSGGYTTQQTLWQIHSSKYTVADTKQWIYSGGYTVADTAVDIQHSRHSGRYTMADIYTVADIQPDILYQVRIYIHSGGYTEVIQDTSTIYTAADTQLRIHSGG